MTRTFIIVMTILILPALFIYAFALIVADLIESNRQPRK